MPDPNKLAKLDEVGYRILTTCGTCRHGRFKPGLASDWGTCAITEYDHGKHTGSPRNVSIVRSGTCSRFEADQLVAWDHARSGFDRFWPARD